MKRFCFLFLSTSAFALLPPLAQSTREIQALITDSHFYESLGSGEAIQEIVRNERGYLVVTRSYAMQIDIEYLHTGKVGPAQFRFTFNEPVRI